MRAFLQRKSVRVCRIIFRWMRICFLLLVLAVVGALSYLHWNGLPDWLKKPVLAHLRERGLQAQFSRMRLGWGPAIIVDDASFQRESEQPEPRLSAKRADLELMILDLARGKVAVKALEVTGASLRFPPAGQASNSLSLDNIRLNLIFPTTNTVRLTNTSASFRGVRLAVSGQLDHAEAVRNWKFLRPGRAKTSWQALLDRLTDTLDQIHFAETPRILLTFNADARDLDTARAHLSLGAPDVATPWGDARRIRLEAFCRHPFAANETILRVTLGADDVATRWAQGSFLHLTANFARDEDFNIAAQSQFSARELDGAWGTNFLRTSGFHWDGAAGLNGTNFHLLHATGNLRIDTAFSSMGSAEKLTAKIDGEAGEPPTAPTNDWGFWAKLAPYHVRFSAGASNVEAPKLKLDSVTLAAEWRAPTARISQLRARLYDGGLDGDAQVDVSTRQLNAAVHATFDERRVMQLLTPSARHWLGQFEWGAPPDVNAQLSLLLPAWTNRHPNWSGDVRDSLRMAGDFAARDGAFRGAPVDRAQGHFGFTNSTWTLPDFRAWREGGEMDFFYTGSLATHEYHFIVDTAVDPKAAENLLPEAQRHWFSEASFAAPPKIHADVRGKWKSPELTGVTAEITATNFLARGEHVDSFAAAVDYTNRFFRVRDARLVKGTEYVTVGLGEADLSTKMVRVTNVLASVTPELLRRLCAPRKVKWLEAIQFDRPPAIRLAGSFQFGQPLATDLGFAVAGTGFHFTNIVADTISGGIRWQGRHAALTNIQAALYHTGTLVGVCGFDWDPKRGTEFSCNFTAKDVDLPALARGVTGRPSKLEGMLDGNLIMDRSNARDRRTWNGLGEVHVHNALLWDIRIFGIFSPVLNAISPGAGNSRAYEASAHYVITNGVVATDDLTVRSTGFRLLYRGSVNIIDKEMDARVEAEPLRDTWIFGPVLSALLSPLSKLFEYKVSGSLHDPHSEPLYIPQPLMALLRPFHSLKSRGNDNEAEPKAAPPPTPANAIVEPNKR